MIKDAYYKVLHWFFAYPTKHFTLNELAKQLQISKITANQIVTKLIKKDFLRKEVLGRLWRISANQNHFYL